VLLSSVGETVPSCLETTRHTKSEPNFATSRSDLRYSVAPVVFISREDSDLSYDARLVVLLAPTGVNRICAAASSSSDMGR
jgi:hypothetical protein